VSFALAEDGASRSCPGPNVLRFDKWLYLRNYMRMETIPASVITTPRTQRRVLALVWAVATVGCSAAWLWIGSPALLLVPVWLGVFWALRRSVRLRADLPDTALDEREVAQRDRVYLHAYQGVATAALLVLITLTIYGDRSRLSYEELSAALWFVLGLSLGLPSAILAWMAPDEDA